MENQIELENPQFKENPQHRAKQKSMQEVKNYKTEEEGKKLKISTHIINNKTEKRNSTQPNCQ